MKVDLTGKAVVVTGAASGIGLATAQLIALSGGCDLMLTDRDAAGLDKAVQSIAVTGSTVKGYTADLSDKAAPEAIIAATIAAFGRVDGLLNAAGLTTRASFLDASPEVWDALFSVNSRAAFFLMQGAIVDMKRRGSPGAIVNILSMNAHCGIPELAVYSATKGALATLTKNAANAHMADRIRVNGINLGWVATQSEHRMQAETLGRGSNWEAETAREMPLGRLVTAEEAARLAVFLLADASIPISGVLVDLEQKVTGRA